LGHPRRADRAKDNQENKTKHSKGHIWGRISLCLIEVHTTLLWYTYIMVGKWEWKGALYRLKDKYDYLLFHFLFFVWGMVNWEI